MRSFLTKAALLAFLFPVASTPLLAGALYERGLTTIPQKNVPPTNPLDKFFATFKPMNLVEKTELCHGIQRKPGIFSDDKYDMYVIRTKVYEKAPDGDSYLFDIYAQFNDDAVTATFIWNAETASGMTTTDITVKTMYQGICNQSAVVLRTKEEQLAISSKNPSFAPVTAKPCEPERTALKVVEARLAKAELDAEFDPGKREIYSSSSPAYRIQAATENATIQSRHNVIIQSIMTEKVMAEKTLMDCKNPGKQQAAAPVSPAPDPLDQIRKLKALLDDKIITQEEFDKKKADLLK
ncbi:SHOCT domain-containing protein [Undibacterium sp. Ji50W]|uniref:SHOCT domain-containing protein n=1 Tax=Undibacterium sp. Ji50W TaxID=3413041 RepID=UPI003BF04F3F